MRLFDPVAVEMMAIPGIVEHETTQNKTAKELVLDTGRTPKIGWKA